MIFNIEFWNTEQYLPTKRHRVLRTRYVKNSVDIEIKELTEQEFPVAFIVHDYQSVYENAKSYSDFDGSGEYKMFSEEIRTYDGKLYKPVRITHGSAISLHFESLDYIKDSLTDSAPYWKGGEEFTESSIVKESNIEECKEKIFRNAEDYIIFDGRVWEACGEPIYLINTFGLGCNHGCTGFFVEYLTNPNISTNNYFNALEREEAITYGKQVAADRGDTDSIEGMGDSDIIEVLMPEMVRFCPQKECSKTNLADSTEEKKNTVYVVMCGCVGDHSIHSIHSSQEKADAEVEKMNNDEYDKQTNPWVEDWEVD